MNNIIRQERILEILSRCESASVAMLAEKTGVTTATIRRDLEILEQRGSIIKTHGSAMLCKNTATVKKPLVDHEIDCCEEKRIIASRAASLIEQRSVVCFDPGVTTSYVADYLPDSLSFTAVVTGLMNAVALCSHENVEVVGLGGTLHKPSYAVTDFLAVDNLRRFRFDISFLSAKGIQYPHGIYETYLSLIPLKKAIVASSRRVVLLADHSKFHESSLYQSVAFSDIDTVITDSGAPGYVIDDMKKDGINVIIADE